MADKKVDEAVNANSQNEKTESQKQEEKEKSLLVVSVVKIDQKYQLKETMLSKEEFDKKVKTYDDDSDKDGNPPDVLKTILDPSAKGKPSRMAEVTSPAPSKTVDLKNYVIPGLKEKGAFDEWLLNVNMDEFLALWNDPASRDKIESRLRANGGYHEWLLVSRTPVFKSWGINPALIYQDPYRTLTSKVSFSTKKDVHVGNHCGGEAPYTWSTSSHNQILRMITAIHTGQIIIEKDGEDKFALYRRMLRIWADDRLYGNRGKLSDGMKI